jgi:hypothetical protein
MSNEIIDVPQDAQPVQEEVVPQANQAQTQAAEQIQTLINNELRFAEETIVRALRAAVVNVVNVLQNAGR